MAYLMGLSLWGKGYQVDAAHTAVYRSMGCRLYSQVDWLMKLLEKCVTRHFMCKSGVLIEEIE